MSGTRRFPASARRLRKAREDGDVAKSRDLTGAFGFLSGSLGILFFTSIYKRLHAYTREVLTAAEDFHTNTMLVCLEQTCRVWIEVLGPVLATVFISVFIVEVLQVGMTFSMKPLGFRPSRLNVLQGIKRILGMEGDDNGTQMPTALFYQILKMLICLLALGFCAAGLLRRIIGGTLGGEFQSTSEVVMLFRRGGLWIVSSVFFVLVVVGVIDLLYCRNKRSKRLSMDQEEFKREMRESEGDPDMRGMRKALHQQILLSGLAEGVRRAKVVVVNR